MIQPVLKNLYQIFLKYNFIYFSFVSVLISKNTNRAVVDFPNIPGYKTLACDLHIHTVFSDGSVWPDIRIQEALKDQLDVIAMTEHLEIQNWKADIPHPDRNRSFNLATEYAQNSGLVVLNGSEITREMPPGHANAIFLKDANKLLLKNPLDVYKEAKNQGAFIFWNHPHWIAQSPDANIPLDPMHIKLIKNGLINGIEVVNDTTFSEEALQLALDYDLTIIGTSDIHGIIDWQYRTDQGGHRPVTLVFSTEKTKKSIKKALFSGRTAVWFKDNLIGKYERLLPLLKASLGIEKAEYIKNSSVVNLKIKNKSSVPFIMRNVGDFNFYSDTNIFTVEANSFKIIDVKTKRKLRKFDLQFEVINAITAPNTHPVIKISVSPKW